LNGPEYKGKTEIVYEQIRKAILDGLIKPGDKLDTDAIAAAFSVSRMPVREAIKRLQLEGWVDVKPHKEVRVASVTKAQIRDVFAVRAMLESLAAREAAEKISEVKIDLLWQTYRDMETLVQSGDTLGQVTKNREFHDIIHQVSGNKVLQSIASNLFDSIERYRLQFLSLPRRPNEVLKDHRKLLEAIESHDRDSAEILMRRHIENTGRIMLGYAGK
jgi:DNA-binding GntR family transcriptional regulator